MSPTRQTADAVDVTQASELTGLSKKALRRRLERGTLDSIKVGGRRMIPISELSRRGLLDTGEDVGEVAEADGRESPAAMGHEDGNGSSPSPAAPPPTADRESPAGPVPAEPAVHGELRTEPPSTKASGPHEPAAPPPSVEAPLGREPPVAPPIPEPQAPVAPDRPPASTANVEPTPVEPAATVEPPRAQEPSAVPPLPPPAPAPAPPAAPPPPPLQAEAASDAPQAPSAASPDAQDASAPGTMPTVVTGAGTAAPAVAPYALTYPAQAPPGSPAPLPAADGGITPPPDRYQASPEGFYPARGAWYYWYEYPAIRWLAALVGIALVALLAWLLLIRPGGGDGDGRTGVQAGAGPVGATQEELVTLSQELRQPVYWAGDLPGTRLEVTQSNNSYAYVRYLTDDAPVGDPSPDFLTVGTYPSLNAFGNLRSYADRSDARTSRIDNGGLAVTVPGSPTSVYFGYPHEDVQVEVYDPERGRALNLVKTGVIRPVTVSTPTAP